MAFKNIDSLRIVAYGFLSSSFLFTHLFLFFPFFKKTIFLLSCDPNEMGRKERISVKIKKVVRTTRRKWDIKQNIDKDNQIITTNSLQNAIACVDGMCVSVWEVLEYD